MLLLGFLANKLDSLVTTGGVKQLSEEVGHVTTACRTLIETHLDDSATRSCAVSQ